MTTHFVFCLITLQIVKEKVACNSSKKKFEMRKEIVFYHENFIVLVLLIFF